MRRRSNTIWALSIVAMLAQVPGPALIAAPSAGQAAINETLALIDAGRADQALLAVKKALAAEPDRVEAHLLYIRLMTDLGKRAEVQAEYTKRRDLKKDGLSLMLYGRTLEDLTQMEATFKKALTLDPKLGWAHYCLATLHVQRNQIDKAVASLEEAIRIQPNFTQAMESLGTLYVGLGRFDKAIANYEKVVAASPENAQALFQLGSLVGKQGNAKRAAELLERSLKLAPGNPQVMGNLAFMYFKLKRYDEAIALYDKALAADPSYSEARLNREVVKRVKKGDVKFEAVAQMEHAMEASTPEQAIARYRRVIELSPNFELPYVALAQLLLATNKVTDAEKAFQKALQLNPGFVEGVRMLAEFYLISGQPQKAEPYLAKAITLQPKEPELHAALGTIYLNTNQAVKAEQSFQKALDLLPAAMALPTRLNRSRAVAAQGRYTDAVKDLQAMLKSAPGYVPANLELALNYFAMEEFDKAREQLKVVKKADPKNKQVDALIKEVETKQAEYKAKSKDQMRARHILVKTQAEAEGILKQIRGGANFEQMARQKSIAPEAAAGGDVGFFKKGELLPEFEKTVASLKPGEVSGVVKTSRGYHIIKRLN